MPIWISISYCAVTPFGTTLFTPARFGPCWNGLISVGLPAFLTSVCQLLLFAADCMSDWSTLSNVSLKASEGLNQKGKVIRGVAKIKFGEGGCPLMGQCTWTWHSQYLKQPLVSLWIALALKGFLLCIENTSFSVSEISNLTYGVTSVKGLLV